MAARNIYNKVAYGFNDPLTDVFQRPLVSNRDPNGNDKYALGTTWVNKSTDTAFILCSVFANVANWVGVAGGGGIFTSLTVNPGDVNVTAGNLIVSAGDITATNGNIVATAGAISSGTTITATGDLITTSGDLIVTTGNASITLGNLTVSAGDITVTAGGVDAGAGSVIGGSIEAHDDLGGTVGNTTFTNVTNTSISTGTLVIKSTSANAGNSAGFLKGYAGTTPIFIPFFTVINP